MTPTQIIIMLLTIGFIIAVGDAINEHLAANRMARALGKALDDLDETKRELREMREIVSFYQGKETVIEWPEVIEVR